MAKFTFLLLFIFSLSFFEANAQTEKSEIYIQGASNLNFSNLNFDNSRSSEFRGNGSLGYFVADNFLLALEMYYLSEGSNKTYSYGAKGRYYLNNFFLGAGYRHGGYNSEKSSGIYYPRTFESRTTFDLINFEIGYAFFLNEIIALEPTLTYVTYLNTNDLNNLAFNLSVAVYF